MEQDVNSNIEEKENKNVESKSSSEKSSKATKKPISVDKADEYIAKLNNDLLEQKKLADEYFDSLRRNMADFDNFKKRISKEKDSLYTSIVSDIVSDLLPILDNFDIALKNGSKDEKFKMGMQMICNQIKETIKKFGVTEIASLGEEFDPVYHEAVMHVKDDSKKEKEIVEVLRKGYKVKDKVIRHAMVKVAN